MLVLGMSKSAVGGKDRMRTEERGLQSGRSVG